MISLLLVILSIHSYSSVVNVADNLFFNGENEKAYIEYKRAFFYYPDSIKSKDYAKFLINIYKEDSVSLANILLDDMDYIDDGNKEFYKRMIIYYGDLYRIDPVFTKEYGNDSIEIMIDIYRHLCIGDKEKVQNLLLKCNDDSVKYHTNIALKRVKKHPEYSIFMSMIIPGSGFWYLGEYKTGTRLFVVNSLLWLSRLYMYYTYYPALLDAIENRALNAGVIRLSVNAAMGDFIYNRFDDGNRKLIAIYASDHNFIMANPLREYILSFIEDKIFQ